jgi:tRNA-modifying protein YgfZ
MKLYSCDKTVLRFYPKAASFLNGYTTNTVDAPRTAFVDLHGRIVAVADQFKKSEDEVWIVVESPFAGRLTEHLKKFLSFSDTHVEALSLHVYYDIDQGRLLFSKEPLSAEVTDEEFTRFRLEKRIPLQGRDFDQEMLLNLGDESLVSYAKGCYLGQEIVARVHYKGRPPKRLEVRDGRFVFVENT